MNGLTVWHWLALAGILSILEVTLGSHFILLCCALAALFTGIIVWILPVISTEFQGLLFGLGIIMSLGIWRKYFKNKLSFVTAPYLNQRARQYLNRHFTLQEPIVNGRGRVKVDDTIWRVEGEDLSAGTRIKVVDVDGVILIVKKVEP